MSTTIAQVIRNDGSVQLDANGNLVEGGVVETTTIRLRDPRIGYSESTTESE